MAVFLDWFASHNTLVIQSLAGIVALLIVFLIFRLLFTSNVEAEAAKNVTYAQLEEKLNKLLEQQSQMKSSVMAAEAPIEDGLGAEALAALSGDPEAVAAAQAAATASAAVTGAGNQVTTGTATTGAEQIAELSRLRAEISTLKDSLKRKENEIIDSKEQAQSSADTSQAETKLNDLSDKITDYETEIGNLKNRLSDYEIIAEDIADLQALKKENQELKNRLANEAAVSTPVETNTDTATDLSEDELMAAIGEPADSETTDSAQKKNELAEVSALAAVPDPEPELDLEIAPEDLEGLVGEVPTEKVEPELPADFFAAANEIMDESIADSEPESDPEDDKMPEVEVSKYLDTAEAREVSKGVKKEDKILLDEFEKHFAKDED